MHQAEPTAEQTIAELKIRFFDYREQAESRMVQLEGALRTILEAAGAQSVEEVLEQFKSKEEAE